MCKTLTEDHQSKMSTTKKTATLPTLPRELRQNIIAFAFEDAASKDITFNQSLRKLTWDMKEEALELVEMVNHPRYIGKEPFFYQSYVPAIHRLADALIIAFPALEEDVRVMLKKCLDSFEEENNEVYKKHRLEEVSKKSRIPVYLPFPRPAQRGSSWFTIAKQSRRVRLG